MPLFRRKAKAASEPEPPEHAVITHLTLSDDAFGTDDEREAVYRLEGALEPAAAAIGGDHDGNEFGGGEAVLYTYGPDADALWAVVEPLVRPLARRGSYAVKRYGAADDSGARQERVDL